MRTTVNLDDTLLTRAFKQRQERNTMLREALNALIQRESARHLARLRDIAETLGLASLLKRIDPNKPG